MLDEVTDRAAASVNLEFFNLSFVLVDDGIGTFWNLDGIMAEAVVSVLGRIHIFAHSFMQGSFPGSTRCYE